jgi:hypothetical protein
VERLTLSEAAERLGISKQAVRQQVQQGTLPHGVWPDGGVYVCIDTKKDGGGETETTHAEKSGGTDPANGYSLTLANAASLVTIVGAATYVTGLLAFWGPIRRAYTHDFVTAWHATSLVPRVVIAGQGVKELLLPCLILALIGSVIALAFMYQFWLFRNRRGTVGSLLAGLVSWFIYSNVVLLFLGKYFLGLGLLDFYARGYKESPYYAWTHGTPFDWMPFFLLAIVMGCILGATYIVARLFIRRVRNSSDGLQATSFLGYLEGILRPLWRRPRRHFVAALALMFGALFFWVLFISISYSPPPLATVEISGTRPAEGKLVTHTDGFWYIFDSEGGLVAIPDIEVKTARVSPPGE